MLSAKNIKKLHQLLAKYEAGTATASEKAFVESYYAQFDRLPNVMEDMSAEQKEETRIRLLNLINASIEQEIPVIPIWKRLTRIASVAAVLILMAGGAYYYFTPSKNPNSIIRATLKNDVLPGTKRATLTLADGSRIVLDTAKSGVLANQGATSITNNNGTIAYAGGANGASAKEIQYNTLTTQKGEVYPLYLSDGSKIILDANTTVRYPVAFNAAERTVEINGRAWFEVAKNEKQPFYVVKGDKKVRVLGTHFDVNAYDNEPELKVTLVEGSVQVVNGNSTGILKPGQQAQLSKTSENINLVNDADVEEATAWINGKIVFHDAGVGSILRAIERWYNVSIEVKGTLPDRSFYFSVSRNATLAEFLKFLEVYKIKYEIDGEKRKLTLYP